MMERFRVRILYYYGFLWMIVLGNVGCLRKPSPRAFAPSPRALAPSPRAAPVHTNGTHSAAPSPSPRPGKATTNGTLEPGQVKALVSLGVMVGFDPCNTDVQQLVICDGRGPVKHVVFLELQFCSPNAVLSGRALGRLGSLESLSLVDCPMKLAPLPPNLQASLQAFTCTRTLGRTDNNTDAVALSGVWLSKLRGLKELTVTDVVVNANANANASSGLGQVVANMTQLQQLTFSNTNISGTLPNTWPNNLSLLNVKQNLLKGSIPVSISNLSQLQSLDLSFNNLTGRIPGGVGSLKSLQMLSLSSNRLWGTIPSSFKNLTFLAYLDLSNNRLNGTIPAFIGNIKGLRYLDLGNNRFRGVLPFDTEFVKNLNTFRVGANPELCFNSSILSPTISGGAEPCDGKGLPSKGGANSPAYAPDSFGPSPEPAEDIQQHHHKGKGPKTVVWAVSIALASIVLVIIIAVVLSRWCAYRD